MHRLLVVAHGTASPAGRATTESLVGAVAAARPDTEVALCFLDVVEPRLADSLDDTPTVVVPLLLSTGYHVQSDIPAAAAAHPRTVVARHLGPHRLVVDALAERLDLGRGPLSGSVVLVGAGSRRPEAAAELATAADLLAMRVGRPVAVHTMAEDLPTVLGAIQPPLSVATYLLAPGQFVDTLRAAAPEGAFVSEPLGMHPALVELVWTRYDEAMEWVR